MVSSRCTEVHPRTRRRCILEAGHLEREGHEPEPYSEEEKGAMRVRMGDDVVDLLERWAREGYPAIAMSGCLLGHFVLLAREGEGQPNGNLIRAAMGAIAGGLLDDKELFVYVAEQLGVPCSELELPGQQRGQA